jgi:hypothetical protein
MQSLRWKVYFIPAAFGHSAYAVSGVQKTGPEGMVGFQFPEKFVDF